MHYNPDDTIAAIGTAAGGALRGMVRLSGPRVLECLSNCFSPDDIEQQLTDIRQPQVIPGSINLAHNDIANGNANGDASNNATATAPGLPCDLFLWPSNRSFTRQPTAELHTLGSPPLLEQLLNTVCDGGARLAQPGEFTLRAFLAGRIDLTQAEAVLGVIDAHSSDDLHSALAQLAGGLSQPLALLREKLLHLLAELEAGLDFVEEDIEFITAEQLRDQLTAAQTIVAEVAAQLTSRGAANDLPRVVLCGPPNAGKSSLFNALVEHYATPGDKQQALVSPQSGTTRDFITAVIEINGLTCELVDTAGIETIDDSESIDGRAQELSGREFERASLIVKCEETSTADNNNNNNNNSTASTNNTAGVGEMTVGEITAGEICVQTKADLLDDSPPLHDSNSQLLCSSINGAGLDTLAQRIYENLTDAAATTGGSLALTATRCNESLRHAEAALVRALELVKHHGGEELIAAETREALHTLGQVVGAVYTDDILDRIFSQFCIGK